MPPEEMTGSTHILEFMCYANSRFRRDKIPHGNGDVIFFRCFGSATPETDRAAPLRRWTPGRTKLSSECATAAAAALVAQSARASRRRMVAMCREGWNYLLIPSSAACAPYR